MKMLFGLSLGAILTITQTLTAAVIVVNTTNHVTSSGQTNLAGAIAMLSDGDTIAFNIPGSGPHYLHTPAGGYPLITKNNVTIDAYSQPGAVPNTNPILASNNAQIKIVLKSSGFTNEDYTVMNYNNSTNNGAGFGPDSFALLGIYGATNIQIKGLCLLGTRGEGVSHDAVAIARNVNRPVPGVQITDLHISGCWIGVDPNWTPADLANDSANDLVFPFDDCVHASSHRVELSYVFTNVCDGVTNVVTLNNRDPANRDSDRAVIADYFAANPNCMPLGPVPRSINLGNRMGHSGIIIGVKAGSSNPRAEFNIILGATINVIMEGQRFRISGNFLGVLPSGIHDYIPPFKELGVFAESHLELGRGASDLVIGTDGDGVNDADERNIMGGVVTDGRFGSYNLGGYRHVVEVYSLSGAPGPERTRIKIAGNYVGVGVDGTTRFTNGVPAFNGSAVTGSQYWIGSDFDGVSDDIEPNVVFNNYPAGLFHDRYTNSTASGSGSHGFFDEPSAGALYSVRGNVTVNNYPFPVNPGRDGGSFMLNYVNKALATPRTNFAALLPVLSTNSTTARIIGTVPAANTNFPWAILDLYIPDPEGLVNGLETPDPNLPNGWVQGVRYLGSFVDNGSGDRDPSRGAFAFDICSLGLTNGTPVTVSANYSMDPPGTHNGRTLTSLFSAPVTLGPGIAITSISLTATTVTINWCGGTAPYQLQKSTSLNPTVMWSDVGGPTVLTTGADVRTSENAFYRVIGN